jgi:hypothetical protein
MEQELPVRLSEGQTAKFVEDDEVQSGEVIGEALLADLSYGCFALRVKLLRRVGPPLCKGGLQLLGYLIDTSACHYNKSARYISLKLNFTAQYLQCLCLRRSGTPRLMPLP